MRFGRQGLDLVTMSGRELQRIEVLTVTRVEFEKEEWVCCKLLKKRNK